MKKQKINHLPLWKKFQSAKTDKMKHTLRNELIEKYYPLVKKIAYSLSLKLNWKVSPDELTSFGVDGLYIAIGKFDIHRGVKFENYAFPRIHGSMVDNMRKEDIIPRSVRLNHSQFEKTRSKLESEKGRLITDIEVAKEMGLSVSEYNKNIKKYHPTRFSSLEGSDMSSDSDVEMFKQDFNSSLISNNTPTPESTIIRKEFFNKLLGKGFNSTERMIVYLYYYRNFTMDKIAEKLKISESRVSQIHKKLLPRMKDKIERNPNYFSKHIGNFIEEGNNNNLLF
jgi:RNA polymerase sigma factor for flagellar operon FliA